jgi:uncharacterized protein (TIGR00299 family) protein
VKTAYLDCFAGISGDMLLGAFVDAGADPDILRTELSKLNIDGYHLHFRRVAKHGISATKADVLLDQHGHPANNGHGHHHHHPHRHWPDIRHLITESELSDLTKQRSLAVFERLASAEGRVHGMSPEEVHFHEVGAIDSIVDIVGTAICLELLGIEQLLAAAPPLGRGFVECQHGTIPVPAPATVELLKDIPTRGSNIEAELVTPTGAAVIAALAAGVGIAPDMTFTAVGYGAGTKDLPIPNLLRVLIGELAGQQYPTEELTVLEANLDDMNPELFPELQDQLLAAGALDVWLTPINMKKGRPGTMVSTLCRPGNARRLKDIYFLHSTTLGIRIYSVQRQALAREMQLVATPYGNIRVKVATFRDQAVTIAPEFEDCRAAAQAHGLSTREVYMAALAAAHHHKPTS